MKLNTLWPAMALIVLAAWQTGRSATGQDYASQQGPRNISGLVSGYEAWQLGDIRRRAAIGMQVDLEGDMYWRWSGVGSYYPGFFEAWPMVPGSVWGWPAGVGPPRLSPTQFMPAVETEAARSVPADATLRRAAPKVARAANGRTATAHVPTGRVPTGRVSAGAASTSGAALPASFVPGPAVEESRPRQVYPGPRNF
jgi:hypothetical protein